MRMVDRYRDRQAPRLQPKPHSPYRQRDEQLAGIAQFLGDVAPAAGAALGTGAGALVGTTIAPGLGTAGGAALGGALGGAAGQGWGALATGASSAMREPHDQADMEELARQQAIARIMAAL